MKWVFMMIGYTNRVPKVDNKYYGPMDLVVEPPMPLMEVKMVPPMNSTMWWVWLMNHLWCIRRWSGAIYRHCGGVCLCGYKIKSLREHTFWCTWVGTSTSWNWMAGDDEPGSTRNKGYDWITANWFHLMLDARWSGFKSSYLTPEDKGL